MCSSIKVDVSFVNACLHFKLSVHPHIIFEDQMSRKGHDS